MLHLYTVVACRVCLLDLTSRPCTLGSKQFRTVAQVNPYGKVPALQDGNLTLVRHSSCRLFGHVRLRNMCLALLRSWQLPQQHPYLNTCEGGSFLARAQTESGAMLQYLMEKYDKKVQTLEDRALVRQLGLLCLHVAGEQPPSPACSRPAVLTPDDIFCAAGGGYITSVSCKHCCYGYYGLGCPRVSEAGRRACLLSLACRCCPTGRKGAVAAPCEPPAPHLSPAPCQRPRPRVARRGSQLRGAPLDRQKSCSTRTSRARRSRRC